MVVLKILSRQPGLHGYAIMAAIEELPGEVLRIEEARWQSVTAAVNQILKLA